MEQEKRICQRKGCTFKGTEQDINQFLSTTKKIKYVKTCFTCRDMTRKWKANNKEYVKLSNECTKNNLNFKEEKEKRGILLEKKPSNKRIENIFDENGNELAWCGTHKEFLPVENFGVYARRFNGLRTVCKECFFNDPKRKKNIGKEMECEICGIKLKYKSYHGHIKLHKDKEENKEFICQPCGNISFSSQKTYDKHLNAITHLNTINKTIIEQSDKFEEKIHQLKADFGVITDNYKCRFCDFQTFDKGIFLEHDKKEHDNEYQFDCTDQNCDKRFKSEYDLFSHIDRVHCKPKFICPHEDCDQKFKRKDHLTRHLKSIKHQGTSALMKCPNCSEIISKRGYKERHLKICVTNTILKGKYGNKSKNKPCQL